LASSPYALPSLLAFAAPGHVTFGTDWPYANSEQAGMFTEQLDAALADADLADGIRRGNAEILFPRLTE
jgi:predicted TIM-barrel fold metal-dependent hydrolase